MLAKKVAVSAIAVMLALTSTYIIYSILLEDSGSGGLKRFSSYNELKNFVKSNVEISRSWFNVYGFPPLTASRSVFGGLTALPAAAESSPQYSQTNIQVAGVDEPDIVKTDGEYIYYVKGGGDYSFVGRELVIVKAYPPEEMKVVSKIVWGKNVAPLGLFVSGSRLAVFLSSLSLNVRGSGPEAYYPVSCRIEVYDLSDVGKPRLARNLSLDGYYLNARMIDEYVYTVTASPLYYAGDEIILPSITVDGRSERIDPRDVYYTNTPDVSYSFTTITALNIFRDDEPATIKTILTGAASSMYVSKNSIYLAVTKYNFPSGDYRRFFEETLLYRLSVEGKIVSFEAEGSVPGHVLNQFSMDEYKGFFRVATTIGYPWFKAGGVVESNNIYVLDMNLKVVGRLENFAEGEKVYSVRFMGERAYVVTFKKVDPFFVIDLSDAGRLRILGWLKIPGYSDYLHPLGETHVIGVGKETVEAEEGDFAWYQGIKISLFDVRNVSAPMQVSKYVVGERGTDSPILRDHRALLFDEGRKFMAIPILVAQIDRSKYPGAVPPYAYGEPVWQGLYVFNVTIEHGLVLKGRITHLNDPIKGGISSADYIKFIVRSLYIGDYIYTLSGEAVKVNELSTLEEVGVIKI